MKVTSNQQTITMETSNTQSADASTKKEASPSPAPVVASNPANALALQKNAGSTRSDRMLAEGIRKSELQQTITPGDTLSQDKLRSIKDPSEKIRAALIPQDVTAKSLENGINGLNSEATRPGQLLDQAKKTQQELQQGISKGLSNAGIDPGFAKHLTGQQSAPNGLFQNLKPGGSRDQQGTNQPDSPVGVTTNTPANPYGGVDMPGFKAQADPLATYKNASEAKSALAGNDGGTGTSTTGGTRTGTTADTPKESGKSESWIERIARQWFGPMSNEHANKQDKESQADLQRNNGTKQMPRDDAPDKTSGGSYGFIVPQKSGAGGLVDPATEDPVVEIDVDRLARGMATVIASKVNPNPNDEGHDPADLTGPKTPGVVDPPDRPISVTKAPMPVTGPIRPSGPGGIIGPKGDGQPT